MKHTLLRTSVALALGSAAAAASAEPVSLTVTIENLAPANGTFQTPHWVGFHDGSFNLYNSGEPASNWPEPGSLALERLAEDGNNEPMSEVFSRLQPNGTDATIAGPNGPIAPGDIASMTFELDSTNPAHRFFSYGSMVLPSNDFFYANANPQAVPVFDDNGQFVARDFIVGEQRVRDAGTEVNDEIPENTAFFGQSVPDTGTVESRVVTTRPSDPELVRFTPVADGGNILADPMFAMADFALPGYPLVKISFAVGEPEQPAEPIEPFRAHASLDGGQEVPPVRTRARGVAGYTVNEDHISFTHRFHRLRNLAMAHLHLGAAGENGPVVVNLLPADFDPTNRRERRRLERVLSGRITAEDLVGPLAGEPLAELARAIQEGNVYVNIHTTENPSGEIRGQLAAR